MPDYDISVVICTYNRCHLLPQTLGSLTAQDAGDVRYEVIVVDNNSIDDTRRVIESFASAGVRYIHEGRQGVSHARNTGIAHARAPIIAFIDDDEYAAPDWIATIQRAFDAHPEADCIGGRVAARWEGEPPSWLTKDHWAPIALQERGAASFYADADNPVCLISANLAVRRSAFDRIGMFSVELQRAKDGIGSTEDHEWLLRYWSAGGRCLYVPEMSVEAEVPAKRMTKEYHRRWHTGHGKFCAMMRLYEVTASDGRLCGERTDLTTLFGVAAFTYRELIVASAAWLGARARGRESASLMYENRVRHLLSYIRQRYADDAAARRHSAFAEIASFAKALMQKKTAKA